MIYLIGGSPRCGKTTLAKLLTEKLSIPFESTDNLETKLSQTIDFLEHPEQFPKTAIRNKTNQSNDQMYTEYSAQEIVSAYLTQAKASYETISDYIRSNANEHTILEGFHATPELVSKLGEKCEIRSIFLGRSDLNDIVTSIQRSDDKDDWVINKTKNLDTYTKIAEMLKLMSSEIEEESLKYGLEYRKVDGEFYKHLDEVLDSLCNK